MNEQGTTGLLSDGFLNYRVGNLSFSREEGSLARRPIVWLPCRGFLWHYTNSFIDEVLVHWSACWISAQVITSWWLVFYFIWFAMLWFKLQSLLRGLECEQTCHFKVFFGCPHSVWHLPFSLKDVFFLRVSWCRESAVSLFLILQLLYDRFKPLLLSWERWVLKWKQKVICL